jgi:hypothetical protein
MNRADLLVTTRAGLFLVADGSDCAVLRLSFADSFRRLAFPVPQAIDAFCAEASDPFGDFALTLNWRAAAVLLNPPSITVRTRASRPFGVRGAFLWVSIRFSANRWWFGDFRVPGQGRMDNLLKAHI